MSLFPPETWFATSLPYPSLNVKDIDGCDDHVIKHLPAMLKTAQESPKRSIVIGHFLGVDHVGHRLHASPPLPSQAPSPGVGRLWYILCPMPHNPPSWCLLWPWSLHPGSTSRALGTGA